MALTNDSNVHQHCKYLIITLQCGRQGDRRRGRGKREEEKRMGRGEEMKGGREGEGKWEGKGEGR